MSGRKAGIMNKLKLSLIWPPIHKLTFQRDVSLTCSVLMAHCTSFIAALDPFLDIGIPHETLPTRPTHFQKH